MGPLHDRRESDQNLSLIITHVEHLQKSQTQLSDVVGDLNAMVLSHVRQENQILDPEKFAEFVIEARNFKEASNRIGRVEECVERMEKTLDQHMLVMIGDGLDQEGIVGKVRELKSTEGRRNWFIGVLWVAFVGWIAKHWGG